MKKVFLFLFVSSFVVSGLVFGHGARWDHSQKSESWKGMDRWHGIMHSSEVDSKNTENGISIKIVSEKPSVAGDIKETLMQNDESLKDYFSDLDVSMTALDDGLEIQLTSGDEETVKKLQSYQAGVLHGYFQSRMHGSFGRMGGYHHGRGGFGCGGWGKSAQ